MNSNSYQRMSKPEKSILENRLSKMEYLKSKSYLLSRNPTEKVLLEQNIKIFMENEKDYTYEEILIITDAIEKDFLKIMSVRG